MTTIEIPNKNNYDKQFEHASHEFRAHWNMGREAARNAAIKINDMVSTSHQQYPDWSINKIAQRIYIKHQELEGFSRQTIYNNLNDENRQLIDSRFSENRKKVLEQSVSMLEPNVIEESSIPTTEPQITEQEADEILKDVELEDGSKIEFDQLPKPVLRFAERIELSSTKLELIAKQSKKTILKEHPQMQKQLVEAIAPLTIDQARHTIFQKIRDLENGYLKLEGDHYVKGDSKQREIVKGGDKVLEPIQVAHMDITKSIYEFLFRMTDRSITKGEFDYNKNIIKNTKDYRLSVIKVADKRTLTSFENYFILVSDVALEMLELIQQEFDSRDMKKDLEMQ